MQYLNISNSDNLNARVAWCRLAVKKDYELVNKNKNDFDRYISSFAKQVTAAELIESDDELDLEVVGKRVSKTEIIYLDSKNEIQHRPPVFMERIIDKNKKESYRKKVDVPSNVDTDIPLKIMSSITIEDAMRKYVFSKTVQLFHVDGLTFDFLFKIAKELNETRTMYIIRAGNGSDPLVFMFNGKKYYGFLEGRVHRKRYKLLLHLSELEVGGAP